jgi:chromosome segregation ATPase
MAKRIEGNEIINDSWAAKAVKQGEDLLKVLEKLEQQGKETADQLSKVAKTQSGATAKSIRDITQAVSKSNAERKKSIVIDNEKKTLEEKLKRLRSNKIQQNEELKVQISEQSRINKQLARETTGLAGAYEKESKTLIKLRKQLKDLIITEGEGSKKTQQLKQRVTELDQKLKSADAAAGQFQRNVGNYPNAMGGAIASLKKFAGALGIVGGVQLLNRGLRSTFDIVKNFDQAQANLALMLLPLHQQ